jgi:hypothetical protein
MKKIKVIQYAMMFIALWTTLYLVDSIEVSKKEFIAAFVLVTVVSVTPRELSAPLPPKLPEPIKPVRLNLTELKIQPCGTCPHWENLCLWPNIKPKSMSS